MKENQDLISEILEKTFCFFFCLLDRERFRTGQLFLNHAITCYALPQQAAMVEATLSISRGLPRWAFMPASRQALASSA